MCLCVCVCVCVCTRARIVCAFVCRVVKGVTGRCVFMYRSCLNVLLVMCTVSG